ncbi:MAG: NAD-dependent epimerase/dehydratase family protein [Methylacidiphilales bacterium]|nr:NAD-dependent epimerase/dehydratase family protein [Candidatus Methylacidiphilales bacterium]
MGSRVLITGATGFIGRQLTRDLAASGHEVRILARSRDKAQMLFGDSVEIMVGDLGRPELLEKLCRDREIVYHIGGIYRFGLRHRRELWRINVEGTENLLKIAATAGIGKIIHLSSCGVLSKREGVVSAASPLNENDFPDQPQRLCSYKSSKWHAEQRALDWARKGLPVTIASTTCPIGWGDEAPTPTGCIIRDFLARRFPFSCRTGLNFIGVGDLSRGLRRVAEVGRPGARYLLCHENLWLKEFLDLLARETGLKAPSICLPGTMIALLGMAGEAIDLLNPRSVGARICLESACQSRRIQFFDNSRTRQELNWAPIQSIEENIREAVAWFSRDTSDSVPQHAPVAEPNL